LIAPARAYTRSHARVGSPPRARTRHQSNIAGNSRERQLWLLALTQASCRVSGSAWAELAAPPPDDGGVERHLLHTPVGYVHYVTVAPAAAGQAAGSAPARLSDGSVGAPLLCVHGSGGSSKEFARVVAQLSARGRYARAARLRARRPCAPPIGGS
jgi:hypothetical protein